VVRRFGKTMALLAGIGAAAVGRTVLANGIAGDRLFPSTLTVEDTEDDDEIALPTISWLRRGANGDSPAGRDLDIEGEYSRSLTSDTALSISPGWQQLDTAGGARAGWNNLDLTLKHVTVLNAPHELLVSTGFIAELGSTGARSIGADTFDTFEPVVTFGKGFGDLPDTMNWLRPAAVTGDAGFAVPTGPAPKLADYGLTLQYSLVYLSKHVEGSMVPGWATSLIPLVEFAAESPVGRTYGERTTLTASPGIAWNSNTYQVTVEAMLPLTRATGSGVGVIAQLHIFLDDVFPKPIFGGASE
jgi:hypothetical protein